MTSTAIVNKLQTAVKHHQAGDVGRASSLYSEVLASDPRNADAWHLQGLIKVATGKRKEGESNIRRAMQLKPGVVEFKANLAAVLVNQRQAIEAETLCREILRTDSTHHGALTHLGTALRQQRRLGESLDTFTRATKIRRDAVSLCNLGSVLTELGELDEAARTLTEARELGPNLTQVHINLAAVLREQGRTADALQSLETAQQLTPSSHEAHTNRGNLLIESGLLAEAIEEYQSAIALHSYSAAAVSGLGRALQQLGAWKEAVEAHRLASELEPDSAGHASSYLYMTSLSPNLSREDVVQRHLAWGRNIEAKTPVDRQTRILTADRPLKIGYVSPDFRGHATMRFLYPLLKAHDRTSFEIFLYSETGKEDVCTEKIRQLATHWCCSRPLSDSDLAGKIRQDEIDILVDLAGHTAENRLPVFARKPAPVQISFLGYPTTTGLSRIDYFLTDAIREPGDPAAFFAEQPVFLPNGACCFEATEAPDVSPAPCLTNGYITFGSTHRLEKISTEALRIWSQVLSAVPGSRLLVFRDVLKNESLRDQMLSRLQHAGIDQSRVDFGWELPSPHLKVYSQIDILLDVFPWGSGTIAYDAMWMGVPIPTIAGDRGGCRATASMMHHCGLPQFMAESSPEYLEIVTQLAADRERLAQIRHQIRPAMAATVCNGNRFARDIEDAYRTFWQRCVQAETRQRQKGSE